MPTFIATADGDYANLDRVRGIHNIDNTHPHRTELVLDDATNVLIGSSADRVAALAQPLVADPGSGIMVLTWDIDGDSLVVSRMPVIAWRIGPDSLPLPVCPNRQFHSYWVSTFALLLADGRVIVQDDCDYGTTYDNENVFREHLIREHRIAEKARAEAITQSIEKPAP
jgi:hypothetical protein